MLSECSDFPEISLLRRVLLSLPVLQDVDRDVREDVELATLTGVVLGEQLGLEL